MNGLSEAVQNRYRRNHLNNEAMKTNDKKNNTEENRQRGKQVKLNKMKWNSGKVNLRRSRNLKCTLHFFGIVYVLFTDTGRSQNTVTLPSSQQARIHHDDSK